MVRATQRDRGEGELPPRVSKDELPEGISPELLRRHLSEKIRIFSLPDAMRRMLLDHKWRTRYKTIRHWLYIVGFLNAACGINDCFIVPAHDVRILCVARTAITLLFVACGLFFYSKRTIAQEGLLVVIPCSTLLLIAGCPPFSDDPFLFERLVMNACFVIASGLIFLRVDFAYLCAIVGITSASLFILVSAADIPLFMSKFQIIVFHVCGLVAILNRQRIMMVDRYRGIIVGLNHDIQTRELAELNDKLEAIAKTDQLTGLLNRRGLDQERGRMAPDRIVSKLMIDIDNFKRLNDTHGHREGDHCLMAVARCIRDSLRPEQIAARFGGEEFLLVLPDVTLEEAIDQAEALRGSIAALPHPPGLPITVSIGIARGLVARNHSLRVAADEALYRAKASGKNRVEYANAEDLVHAETICKAELLPKVGLAA